MGCLKLHILDEQLPALKVVKGANEVRRNVAQGWLSTDPLATKFAAWSPYNFVLGNPIMYVDPDGREPDIVIHGENNSSLIIKTDMIDVSVDASALGIGFGGNYTLSGNDFLITGLDIVGMVDPTPISDGLSATLSFESGDWLGAGASLLGAALPFAGDLAKLPKIAKGMDRISDAIKSQKKFGGAADTFSGSTREAFRKAKDQNGIPRSQQPDATRSVPEKGTGNPLREYDFTNSKGNKVSIRKDNPRTYPDGGKQGDHYNAGPSNDKLRQHHNVE